MFYNPNPPIPVLKWNQEEPPKVFNVLEDSTIKDEEKRKKIFLQALNNYFPDERVD